MELHNAPLILIIDDEEAILKTLKDALTDEAYRVETLSQGEEALDAIGKLIPDLVMLDIFMPKHNGLKLLTQIKKEFPDQKVIMISGFGNIPIAIEAIHKGAIDFIEKPLNLDEILCKIEFLKKQEPVPSPPQTTLQANNIIGESNLFLELIHQINLLAKHRLPVLICGEYGTGKSLLANYIHNQSPLAKKPFKIINCETDETLNEELSVQNEQTVYLKHVCHLTKSQQKQLVSLLKQNKQSRIIASSKTSLFALVQQKAFSETLFYLLNKAPLEVPSLRKRPYDIPLLIHHYAKEQNKQYKKQIVFSTQAIRALRNYSWPGNISELQQVIEKVIITSEDYYEIVSLERITALLGEQSTQFIEEQSMHLFESLDHATSTFKRQFLLYLLKKNRYDIKQVSSRLNLSPTELKNKLQELNIETP